jgi:translocation and assembly module TamB
MRALKITVIVVLFAAIVVMATLSWLVRSEQGSRWLLQYGLELSPVTIEASGISGTLADGLMVDRLFIALPVVEIHAEDIVFSWSPSRLLAGIVDINSAHIAELGIDIMETESSNEPIEDELFWLQIPLHISIESARLDRLRIDATEFDNLDLAGTIGHGQLEIKSLAGQVNGIIVQASGELEGPAPGRLRAIASWEMPAENLDGSGGFNGDIERLAFEQVINVPETVNFSGTIHDLFSAPSLTGVAEWPSVRIPGEMSLYSNNGKLNIHSDFLSAHLEGSSNMLLDSWPQAPLQIKAFADLRGIRIDSYAIDALDGHITGYGRIDYSEGLQGQLLINGTGIDTSMINAGLPGQLGFDANLLIESMTAFVVDISKAKANIADKDLSGAGRVQWREAKLAAIDASITAGTNRLTADVKLNKQLAGRIKLDAPELAMLWPGLQGSMDANVTLGGNPEHPQVKLVSKARSVSYGLYSLDRFKLNAALQSNNTITGKFAAIGLVSGEQQLGNLDLDISGTVADHVSMLTISDGAVDVNLQTRGSWDGKSLSQRFDHGRIQPDGFDSWQLQQKPELRITTADGQLGAHCWKQRAATICFDDSHWDDSMVRTAVVVDDFTLASLQPLLAEGYSLDGNVDADLKLSHDSAGLQGELHWRQSPTLLSYSDDIDKFQTVLDEVRIDLVTDTTQTRLDANLNGEQGFNMIATVRVNGPLAPESPLQVSAKGILPSIGLLRPLIQRVAIPGELQGKLMVDLEAGGTLGDPLFNGGAYLTDGKLGLPRIGITLSDINAAAESKGTDKLLVTGSLRSGDGTASIVGEIHTTENTDLLADIQIQGQKLATVRVPDLSVDTSPDLRLRIGEGVFDISGRVLIPSALAEIRQLPKTAVPRSADVIVHAPDRDIDQGPQTIVTGNVELVLGEDVRFNGFGLSSTLDGALRLTQQRGGFLRSGGTVRVRDGFLTGYGRELRVDRGELTFVGPLDDPLINIQVSRESIYEGRQYIIGLRLTGSAQNVRTEPFSRPSMSENDVLSFLLLDRPASTDSDATGAAVALGLQQLLPDQSGRLGLDEVSFETNDANQAAMVAGRRINDRLHVRYVFGTLGSSGSFRIRYTLGRGFSLEASTGSRQSMDLIYMLER